MKAEHRHELKTNELADWIGHLPDWTKQNFKSIVIVGVVLVAVVAVYIWRRWERGSMVQDSYRLTSLLSQIPFQKIQVVETGARGADESYTLLTTAQNLASFAQSTKYDRMAAIALIKQGEVLRAELHYRLTGASEDDRVSQISKAKAAYAAAIERASGDPSLTANAKVGLGLCEEELSNFTEAESMYREIAEAQQFKGTTGQAAAAHRLKIMDDFRDRVTFAATVARPTATPQLPFGALPVTPVQPPVEVNAAGPAEANAPPAVGAPAAPLAADAQPEEAATPPEVNEPAETPSPRR